MVGTQRLEHAQLFVEDLDAAVTFYTDVLGLALQYERDETAYLTCGYNERYDIVVTEGSTGVEYFALRVDSTDVIEQCRESLKTADTAVEPAHQDDAPFTDGVRFSLPSGIGVVLLVVTNARYRRENETVEPRGGVAPVDLDHITLMTDSICEDVAFLEEHVGMSVSEIHKRRGDAWRFAWTRLGNQHHDVAFVATDESDWTLHHLAWTMTSIDHVKSLCDRMAQYGHGLEVGVSRHVVGSNVFAYFREPGGNRFELSTEMATLDDSTETRVNEPGDDVLTAWGGIRPPESYSQGS